MSIAQKAIVIFLLPLQCYFIAIYQAYYPYCLIVILLQDELLLASYSKCFTVFLFQKKLK